MLVYCTTHKGGSVLMSDNIKKVYNISTPNDDRLEFFADYCGEDEIAKLLEETEKMDKSKFIADIKKIAIDSNFAY